MDFKLPFMAMLSGGTIPQNGRAACVMRSALARFHTRHQSSGDVLSFRKIAVRVSAIRGGVHLCYKHGVI
jgi:hypothetical protein